MYPQKNLLEIFFKMVELTESRKSFASLPYIKGVTEPLIGVLKKHDVTVVNKPFTTLQQQFPAPKFRPSMESQTNVVYKIPCTNQIVRGAIYEKPAELLIPEKKNIWETPKLRPKVLELLIHLVQQLKTRQLLRKALLEPLSIKRRLQTADRG